MFSTVSSISGPLLKKVDSLKRALPPSDCDWGLGCVSEPALSVEVGVPGGSSTELSAVADAALKKARVHSETFCYVIKTTEILVIHFITPGFSSKEAMT